MCLAFPLVQNWLFSHYISKQLDHSVIVYYTVFILLLPVYLCVVEIFWVVFAFTIIRVADMFVTLLPTTSLLSAGFQKTMMYVRTFCMF